MKSPNFLPPSPREDPSHPEGSPSADTPPPIERETKTMTQGDLDRLRESCSVLSGVQIRLLEANETITSTLPGDVIFYEATFYAGLCLPVHPIIRRIL